LSFFRKTSKRSQSAKEELRRYGLCGQLWAKRFENRWVAFEILDTCRKL